VTVARPARRLRPAITATAADTTISRFAVDTRLLDAPLVATTATPLAPTVTIVDDRDDDAEPHAIRMVDQDLVPLVDTVPIALVDSLVTTRTRVFAIASAARVTLPLVGADTTSAPVVLTTQATRTTLPVLDVISRTPTPPGAFSEPTLRGYLVALFKASGLASPQDLTLIGIYERIPGGAVASVSLAAAALKIRVAAHRTPRPATLVVGRSKTHGSLITTEV
jgi:hypothetical protein